MDQLNQAARDTIGEGTVTVESWRPVAGTNGMYEVSDLGRVRSWFLRGYNHQARGGRREVPVILAVLRSAHYPKVSLRTPGVVGTRRVSIHLLVLEAFAGPRPYPAAEGSHINGDSRDARATNLCWESRSANWHRRYGHGTATKGEANPRAKITEADVRDIRIAIAAGATCVSQATKYGLGPSTVSAIKHRKLWPDVV